MDDRKNGLQSRRDNDEGGGRAGRRRFMRTAGVLAGAVATGLGLDGCGDGGISAASAQSVGAQIPAIVPAQTALVIMHYQTDILGLFPSVAPTLLANTRKLCDAARAKGVSVYFAKIQFSPGYPEVSPLNKNGQGLKQLGLFINAKSRRSSASRPANRSSSGIVSACFSAPICRRGFPRRVSIR